MGCDVGGPGGIGSSKSSALGEPGRSFPDLVPAGRRWFPLRRRIQDSGERGEIHHSSRAGRVSGNRFSARRAGRLVGCDREPVDRRGHAMGLFGVIPELFRARGGLLSRLCIAPKHAGGCLCALQRDPRQSPPGGARKDLVVNAEPTLRADERERRLWFHLRCGMAGAREDQRSSKCRACVGQCE